MNANDYWHLFLETGAPEMYLCFIRERKLEGMNVSDGTGGSSESFGLQ